MNTVPTPPEPLEADPAPLHPSWCRSDRCSAPDRVAERGQVDADVPMTRRGSHYSAPWIIPITRISEVQISLELVGDVYAPTTEIPESVQLEYFAESCGHAGVLNLTPEQIPALATAFTAIRDAFDPDRNALVDRVAQALRVLGCVTRQNADSQIYLSTVHLTDREREAVLAQFPGGES